MLLRSRPSRSLGASHLAALEAAQVLELVGARAQAHCAQQLRLDGGQPVAVAAVGTVPLVRLYARMRAATSASSGNMDSAVSPCSGFLRTPF
jgi:hypothetical protein